jgi:hypothetical protein
MADPIEDAPNETFDPKRMQEIVEELRRQGKLPPLDEFLQAVGRVRERLRPEFVKAVASSRKKRM